MTDQQQAIPKINIFLASTDIDRIMHVMYDPFLSDPRFHIASVSATWRDLTDRYPREAGELLLIEADIAPNPDMLMRWLQTLPTPAVVVLPDAWAHIEGKMREVRPNVRNVFVGETVNYHVIARCVYDIVITERSLRDYAQPARAVLGGNGRQAIVGTRIIAVWGKGGSGKSTLSSNLAWELARRGLRTLAIGLDVPDALSSYFDIEVEHTSLAFFQRPDLEGFRASMTHKDNLDIIFSPNDALIAEEIARRPPDHVGSIRNMVLTAAGDGYAAVILDLPAERTEWAIQPLIAANTVLLVAQPSLIDLLRVVNLYQMLTETLAGRHRVALEAIHLVMNEVSDRDNMLPRDFHNAAQQHLKRPFPPSIGSIPFDTAVRLEQNRGQMPLLGLEHFARSIRALANTLFPTTASNESSIGRSERAGHKVLELIGLR